METDKEGASIIFFEGNVRSFIQRALPAYDSSTKNSTWPDFRLSFSRKEEGKVDPVQKTTKAIVFNWRRKIDDNLDTGD